MGEMITFVLRMRTPRGGMWLFGTPSFAAGFLSIFSPFVHLSLPEFHPGTPADDATAIGSDWKAVGRDIYGALTTRIEEDQAKADASTQRR